MAALLQDHKGPRISAVQFGLLDPEIVRRQSVLPITTSGLYTRQLPTLGGLNDLRMGTCDRRLFCGTCRHDIIKCPGHFGHLDLAVPMYHVSMVPIVIKMLRCVCVFCSHLLVEMDEADARLCGVSGRDRLMLLSNLCKSRRRCPQCEAPQPSKYIHSRPTTQISIVTAELKFESEEEELAMNRPFTAARAREILAGISDSHIRILGASPEYSRPAWMILTLLQIPPPISRPCITASDGSRTKGQDDVTVKLLEIFKANKAADAALREADCPSGFMPDIASARPYAVEDLSSVTPEKLVAIQAASDNLQQHLVQYFHHSGQTDSKLMSTGGRAHSRTLRLIPDRWRGKKGRFRGNLGGKRVDFSSRTVASPAPDYDVDEVGIPEMVAYHLTFPERVTRFNLEQLTACVRRGCGVKDGASTVVVPGSDPIDLGLCTDRDSIVLEIGWVVERHLIEGDWVLLNRQPSLHRMSIMAHRIRIIKDKTFRLPVCDTTPYNADFDGDELNIHVLQTHDARAEAEMLMSVSTQMINPETNKPIIALVQDSLVAAFLMTQRTTFFPRHQAMQMLMTLRYLPRGHWLPPPAILKPALWTGKQLFSLLFPEHLTFDMVVRDGADDGVAESGGWMDPQERRVRVVRSDLVCGSLCKKTLGTSAGGLVHVLIQDWGFTRAGRFVSDAQRLLQAYMMIRGFSVGIRDCIMGESTHRRVNALMSKTFETTDRIRKEAVLAAPALVDACITKMLGGFLTSGGAEVVKDVNVATGNRISVMIESGAKGSSINIAQILSSVGQQSVEGGRIQNGMDGRTLPCYRRGDTSAGAHGFVCNSYGTGLTAQEYFFHAMGGREGLVDTAVKTAFIGYIQRRLSKAQEGLQVRYDSTVRNTSGAVIQFYYGGDSYYPTKLERTRLEIFGMDNDALRARVVGAEDWGEAWQAAALREFQEVKADRDMVRGSQLSLSHDAGGEMAMPTNPIRAFSRAQSKFGRGPVPPTPGSVRAPVLKLLEKIKAARRPAASAFTRAYLRSHLTLRNLVVVQHLGLPAIEWVCDTLWCKFNEALAEPGEMVGTLGASSIGAPCTQMTLNTFHTAGVLAHTVTQGVPRLKELIDMSAHIRTPSVHINFEQPYASHEHMARMLGAGIEHTYLHEIVQTSEVVWNPVGAPTPDAELVALHAETGGSDSVIRIVLDRKQMYRKKLTVDDAGRAVQAYLGSSGSVIWSEVNMLHWCVRVRVCKLDLTTDAAKGMCLVHDFLLDNVPVHGVHGIKRVIARSDAIRTPNPHTGKLELVQRWSADTEGSNLMKVLGLDGVDSTSTVSNDIHETLAVLGVEAATHQLLTEIRSVLSHDGAYVNDRHLQLLVDVMTHSGVLSPVTRHSMSKLGASVYTRASFEQTQEVLTWAAAMGTANTTNGVTENIMIGNPISGGTGCCDVITHPDALPTPYQPKLVGKLQRAEKQQVVPLNRVAPALVRPLNRASGFIGKKRKTFGGAEQIEKKRRTLMLHSPAPRTDERELVFHSPENITIANRKT